MEEAGQGSQAAASKWAPTGEDGALKYQITAWLINEPTRTAQKVVHAHLQGRFLAKHFKTVQLSVQVLSDLTGMPDPAEMQPIGNNLWNVKTGDHGMPNKQITIPTHSDSELRR